MRGTSRGGVYPLTPFLHPSSSSALVSLRVKGNVWHRRLDHSSNRILDNEFQTSLLVQPRNLKTLVFFIGKANLTDGLSIM